MRGVRALKQVLICARASTCLSVCACMCLPRRACGWVRRAGGRVGVRVGGWLHRLVDSIEECEEKFDVVVDCTGNEQGFDTALNLVKPRGCCLPLPPRPALYARPSSCTLHAIS